MDYNESPDKTGFITNVELMLLQIIAEKQEISGYEINRLVTDRGYRNWANIGTTSIYKGLEKLSLKELLVSSVKLEKKGKGPLPKLFKLTTLGFERLVNSILAAISDSNERDARFDLGLAGIGFVEPEAACVALKLRLKNLTTRERIIKDKFKSAGIKYLPYSAVLVFEHPLFLIKNEIEFASSVLKELTAGLDKLNNHES